MDAITTTITDDGLSGTYTSAGNGICGGGHIGGNVTVGGCNFGDGYGGISNGNGFVYPIINYTYWPGYYAEPNKYETAFKLAAKLREKKLVTTNSVKQFTDLIEALVESL